MFYDLIYGDSNVEQLIQRKYPQAKMKDASDFIHTDRFECEIEDIDDDIFYPFAIREGFARLCLKFEITLQSVGMKDTHDESKAKLDRWIEDAKGKEVIK